MGLNVAQKLIEPHLLSGAMTAGKEIGIRIDQTLTQDATGTLVMLAEAAQKRGGKSGHCDLNKCLHAIPISAAKNVGVLMTSTPMGRAMPGVWH